jgi:prepilin peptidase CpaA
MAVLGLLIFAAFLIAAAASDVARYRVPNGLTLAMAAAALAFLIPQGPGAWASHGLAFGLLGAGALAAYLVGAMGGGDVKLLAAAGLWLPFPSLAAFVLALGLAGAVQAGAVLALRRSGGAAALRARMPYALSIAAGGLAAIALQLAARP